MSLQGVTDFIVAGPPGHTQAGPAGHFEAGPAGHVVIGEAGHVPIDTTPAYVPIDISHGYAGGYGGGYGGGGTSSMIPAPGSMGAGGNFTPGGTVPIDTRSGGGMLPGANVVPAPGASVPFTQGLSHFTPGGNVPTSRDFGHFTPGGFIPITSARGVATPGGSVPINPPQSGHFVPGGHVPMTPKVGMDPIAPQATVRAPDSGRVRPHKMTEWHGPRLTHTQNWPNDTYTHTVSQKAWEPLDSRSTWEPVKGSDWFLTTDMVDAKGLLKLNDFHLPEDPTLEKPSVIVNDYSQPREQNMVMNTNVTMPHTNAAYYIENHTPSYLFEINHVTNHVLAAPERTSGSIVATAG